MNGTLHHYYDILFAQRRVYTWRHSLAFCDVLPVKIGQNVWMHQTESTNLAVVCMAKSKVHLQKNCIWRPCERLAYIRMGARRKLTRRGKTAWTDRNNLFFGAPNYRGATAPGCPSPPGAYVYTAVTHLQLNTHGSRKYHRGWSRCALVQNASLVSRHSWARFFSPSTTSSRNVLLKRNKLIQH